MLIPPEEAELFFNLYPSLIGYVAGRSGGVEGIIDAQSFRSAPTNARAQARDHLLDNISLISDYIKENPDEFREKELGYITDWSGFIHNNFFIVRYLKNYTVFLIAGDSPKAYGVLGLTDEIEEMMPCPLPIYIKAVLLPWKGRIIWDGLFNFYNISFGGGIKRRFQESYRQAKAVGIITSLDPDWKPEKPKPAKKPKTPAIERFLKKKCPTSVAEFKQTYGDPNLEITGEEVRDYGIWSVEGTPSIEADHLMVYANIIRHKALYIYAHKGRITHISVTDPTEWYRGDFKPHEGQRLMT